MRAGAWWDLLRRNRFAVGRSQLPHAVLISGVSLLNELLRVAQQAVHPRPAAAVAPAPVFIVGHWRSGTTLLHELLARDPRNTFPNTYECFIPNHFLLTERLGRWLLKPLLPKNRPMDDMALGWELPQEDEFALCNLGMRSPYLGIAFPHRPDQDQPWETLAELPACERQRWAAALAGFLGCVARYRPGRLVLKTPLHTFRIALLREIFPQARFIHIVRHPAPVYASTVRLWQRLYRNQGLSRPAAFDLEERVLAQGERMFRAYLEARAGLPANRLCELSYEELLRAPQATLGRIYGQLELGDFAPARSAVEAYLRERRDHQPNRHHLSASQWAEVRRRWGFYYAAFGYALDAALDADNPVGCNGGRC